MNTCWKLTVSLASAILVCSTACCADPVTARRDPFKKEAPAPVPTASSAKQSAPSPAATSEQGSDFRGLTVDMKKKTVSGDGRICIAEGILEYLLVGTGGKDYESVVMMNVRPSDLHAAFLMIGAVSGGLAEEFKGDRKNEVPGSGKNQEASLFVIRVEWVQEGKPVLVRGEQLMFNREGKTEGSEAIWAFTGSGFFKDEKGVEHYAADMEGEKSIAATWYDGTALLNLAVKSNNPYRGDSFGFEVNTRKVPKKDTMVKITFQMVDKEGQPVFKSPSK